MCIAIYKPADSIISKETLQRCFNANPDGAGFMYSTGSKIKIRKGFFTFDEFYKAYKPHEHKSCAIHFRIKTHGAVEIANCHPFYVTSEVGFIHNGIISKHGGNTNKSDTRDFNEKVLRPMVKTFGTTIIHSPQIKPLVESYIGYSKLVFLDKDGNATIYNESMGNYSEGVWFSNHSWEEPKPYTYTPKPYSKPNYVTTKNYGYDVYDDYDSDYVGKDAQVNKNFKHLKIGDVVNIVSHSKYGLCEVETYEGEWINYVPMSYLDVLEEPEIQEAKVPAVINTYSFYDRYDWD